MLFIFIFTVFVRIKKHLNCCSFLYSVSPAHNILGPHQGKASTWEPQDQVRCPHGVRRWTSFLLLYTPCGRNMGGHGYSMLGGRCYPRVCYADLGQRTAGLTFRWLLKGERVEES